ncbi:MAG: divalent-cation tolerance protein CutA [Gloeocapsa sp. DLM2.Bin57]|nr:MAG: divalent-cation tolerance protein CutA [Gloeocapsa sp. DLM2.Bin57]
MSKKYGLILVTAGSETEAETIASALITEHLAACVSVHPIKSLYRWRGEINSDTEWQLVIKTDLNLFATIAAKITAIHSYEVPEIIAIPIVQGAVPYLDWLGSCLNS